MDFLFQERENPTPFVNIIWATQSDQEGLFNSVAVPYWEMNFTQSHGQTKITLRGPETKVTQAYCPPNAKFLGIQFTIGTFLDPFPVDTLCDTVIDLPLSSSKCFWLAGEDWEVPNYNNVDVFLNRLYQRGLITHNPIVHTVLNQQPHDVSLRTVQRQFRQATGLTQGQYHQIQRAVHAQNLLEQGQSILDVTYQAGYADHAHLTRSLKRFIGQTPTQILQQQVNV